MDFESVYAVVNEKDLPDGFIVSANSQSLNVSAKNITEDGLLLEIEVKDNANPGVYKIPFMLKDKANHSWNHNLQVNLEKPIPGKYELLPNYPNPFNAETQISYTLFNDQTQETQLVIYDLLGNQIRILVNKKQPAGTYKVIWDGKNEQGNAVASALYFYKITSGSFVKIRKMTLLK